MSISDFDKIHLTGKETRVFRKFKRREKIALNETDEDKLMDLGLITRDRIEKDDIFDVEYEKESHLTTLGERYLDYISKKQIGRIFTEARLWFAVAISAAALTVSIIALLK